LVGSNIFAVNKKTTVKKIFTLSFLRTIAVIILVAGSAGSLALMLYTGRKNPSILLLVVFALWVLSPFAALLAANIASKRWSAFSRVALYWLIIILSLGSLLSYNGTFSPPGTKAAFVFLVVPLISWLLVGIVLLLAGPLSRRSSGRNDSK
jgi:hypothetical protein